MKSLILMLAAAAVSSSAETQTFTGVITDTMCGAKPHSAMIKDRSDAECVKMCVKGPHSFALVDGAAVLKLSDQKTPAKYAARKVKVTGAYEGKTRTIKVLSIEPLDAQ
jgi:hypothetical protein